jgi:hypothetical protein
MELICNCFSMSFLGAARVKGLTVFQAFSPLNVLDAMSLSELTYFATALISTQLRSLLYILISSIRPEK